MRRNNRFKKIVYIFLKGMSSVFFNKGENCISAGRLFVEDKIHDEFVRRVVKDTKTIAIGLSKFTITSIVD